MRGFPSSFDRSLVPTTIKKILSTGDPEPDESFTMDGKSIHQVQVIATITQISLQTTHTLFIIDGQKAKIKCKLWSSHDQNEDIKQSDEDKLKVGDLVKVIGKVDIFHGIRSINVHHISKITNFNHVYQHGLEVIFAYELNNMLINQHIPKCQEMWKTFIKTAHNEQRQSKLEYEKYKSNKNNVNEHEKNLDVVRRNILNFLRSVHKDTSSGYVGQTIFEIKNGIRCNQHQVVENAIQKLYQDGLVFDPTDGHWDVCG
eukprot:UN01580